MAFDRIIRGGTVFDGTGSEPTRADIAIERGAIAAIGALPDATGAEETDARGRYVTPGFIDAHAHSDVSLYLNPTCETQVAQGITTEVMGNCGYSPFPLLDNNRGYLLDPDGVVAPWGSASQYFETLIANGMGINAVPQVGHITVRSAVLDRKDRPATMDEIQRMADHVADAMDAGARGFSTGLDYDPSTVSDLEEIVELVKVVGRYGGFYTSHIRGYSQNVINAVAEAIEVARRTGVPVQISHLNVFGRSNWGKGQRVLDIMDKARAEGVAVACDMMTYRTSGAWWAPRAILPPNAYDWHKPWSENLPELRTLLTDSEARAALKAEIEERRSRPKYGFHEEFAIFSTWRDISIVELAGGSPHAHLLGLDMVDAAADVGKDPCDLFFDLILEEGEGFAAICTPVGPDDFDAFLKDEWTMFGTDAIASSIQRLREPWNTIQPHRRHYGTFPRVFETFVREQRAIELGDAVRRMTGLPADHFGLARRGYIKEGYHADLVVLDLDRVGERATWGTPAAYPAGIEHVLVNGVPVMSGGRFTGALPGAMLAATA
jgi:N-acyl-D-amino-acid deacylase